MCTQGILKYKGLQDGFSYVHLMVSLDILMRI